MSKDRNTELSLQAENCTHVVIRLAISVVEDDIKRELT